MHAVSTELRPLVEAFARRLSALPEPAFSVSRAPGKWSQKEVIGHLVDSAQNNIRRMIVGQYEQSPPRIVYRQEEWVRASDWQAMPGKEVIELWRLLNLQFCQILDQMPTSTLNLLCDTGQSEPKLHSLDWIARDYVRHLKHHLNQVLPGSFDVHYP
ncbi:MAG: DinB family protein [Cyclobacteriaceae bacterium]